MDTAARRKLLIEEIMELRFLLHRDRGLPESFLPTGEDLEKHDDEALTAIVERLRFVSRTPTRRS